MSNKLRSKSSPAYRKLREEFVIATALGVFAIVLHWVSYSMGKVDGFYLAGMLIGLLAGQFTACLYIASRFPALGYFLHVGLVFLLLYFSLALGIGYFFGLGVTFCFSNAAFALSRLFSQER